MSAEAALVQPGEVSQAHAVIGAIKSGLSRVLIDQSRVVELVCWAVMSRGHVLLEGLPGLGKTELAKGLSRLLGLPFRRIQFTPDLLPGDITGTYVLDGAASGKLTFRQGPLFASLVLADEINRASPKTQAALLEAMQERSVTSLGETHMLPDPFFVVATQNPIELEGTYPLPEAQLDRFMFRILVPAVRAATMSTILTQRSRDLVSSLAAAVTPEQLRGLFQIVDRVHLATPVADFIARLVEATDPQGPRAPDISRRYVRFGGSPRAALAIAAGARAAAMSRGRPAVGFEDVKSVVEPALNHRLVLSHEAMLDKVRPSDVVAELLRAVPEVERGA